MMFTGIHVFEPSFLDRVPAEGEQCIVRTAYRSLFEAGQGPAVHRLDGYWWEHSTVERYLAGIRSVLDGEVSLPHAAGPVRGVDPAATVDPSAELIGPVYVGPGAAIEAGARIGPHVQVGAGARVLAGIEARNAAIWPGATLRDTLIDGVCTGAES